MDNYATHKIVAVEAWLARRPHWYVHFTPTSASWIDASWINRVERWFAELTLQRGVHTRKRFTEERIVGVLKEHEAGDTAKEICRRHGISEQTFYCWKSKYGGMEALVPAGCAILNQRMPSRSVCWRKRTWTTLR